MVYGGSDCDGERTRNLSIWANEAAGFYYRPYLFVKYISFHLCHNILNMYLLLTKCLFYAVKSADCAVLVVHSA